MIYPEYYVIGYDPCTLILTLFDRKISYDCSTISDEICEVKFNITNHRFDDIIGTPAGSCRIFNRLEDAKECLEFIKENRDKIRFINDSIMDDMFEEKNNRDTYNPDNLKIYRLPIMELEEVDEATP